MELPSELIACDSGLNTSPMFSVRFSRLEIIDLSWEKQKFIYKRKMNIFLFIEIYLVINNNIQRLGEISNLCLNFNKLVLVKILYR